MKRILIFIILFVVILALTFGIVELLTYITNTDKIGDWAFYVIAAASISFAITRSDYIKDKFFKK